MDNSQQTTNDKQQIINDQTAPQVMPVPNRGGIPIEPVAASPVVAPSASDSQIAPTPTSEPAAADVPNAQADSGQDTTARQVPTPQPSASPVSKEHEPMPAPLPDVAKLSDAEVKEEEIAVEKELESWIEKLPAAEKPKIPEDAKQAGLDHAKADTPMPADPTGAAALSMTYDEASLIRKQAGRHWYYWRKSVAWLAALVMYHWKKIGFTKEK